MSLTPSERALGIQWVLATIVGWLVGFAACQAIQGFISTVLVDGLVIGTAVGFAQWVVLRRRHARVVWWVPLSIIGFGIGKAISEAVTPSTPSLGTDLLAGAIIGAVVGLAQWLVLRRVVPSAWWWILATTVAWMAAWALIEPLERSEGSAIAVAYIVGAIAAGVAGIVTGATLIWLSRLRAA